MIPGKPTRVRWLIPLWVLALGGLVACSDGISGGVDRGAIEQQIRASAARAEAAGRVEQAAILEDGVVTDAEFRQSVVAAVQCMERAGLDVSEIERAETLEGFDLTFMASPNGQTAEDVGQISDECETRFDLAVRAARSIQYAGVLKEDAQTLLRSCFEREGIDAGKAATLDEFMAATSERPDAGARCLAEATGAIQGKGGPG